MYCSNRTQQSELASRCTVFHLTSSGTLQCALYCIVLYCVILYREIDQIFTTCEKLKFRLPRHDEQPLDT